MIPFRQARTVFLLISIGISLPGTPALSGDAQPDDLRNRGISLYDAGDYEGARQIFEAIDAGGAATGPVLYRLAFSRSRAGDAEGAQEAQQRALEKLLAEMATEPTLESAFYLSNTYRNLGRTEDARQVARSATDRFEAGEWSASGDGLALFQVAKLYADQDRPDRAGEVYSQALEELDPEAHPSYVAWARRYLAENAIDQESLPAAIEQLSALAASPGAGARDFDRLAVALARAGRWQEAIAAWKKMEAADLQSADRARYCWRLATQAAAMGSLPGSDPEGRSFRALSKEELEAVMRAQAEAAQAVHAEWTEAAKEGPVPPDRTSSLQARLDAARGPFIAAAMEYALRGLPVRETAFFGGYAPLIFHETRWELAKPKGARGGPRTKGKAPAKKE